MGPSCGPPNLESRDICTCIYMCIYTYISVSLSIYWCIHLSIMYHVKEGAHRTDPTSIQQGPITRAHRETIRKFTCGAPCYESDTADILGHEVPRCHTGSYTQVSLGEGGLDSQEGQHGPICTSWAQITNLNVPSIREPTPRMGKVLAGRTWQEVSFYRNARA